MLIRTRCYKKFFTLLINVKCRYKLKKNAKHKHMRKLNLSYLFIFVLNYKEHSTNNGINKYLTNHQGFKIINS